MKPLFLIAIGLLMSTCRNVKTADDYFRKTKEKYEDIIFERKNYYLKDYGLTKKQFEINKKLYWKLNCANESLLFISGYIRKAGNKIYLIPTDYKNSNTIIETILFDFDARINQSWEVILSSDRISERALVRLVSISKLVGKNIYRFKLVPYEFINFTKEKQEYGYEHYLDVSLEDGIERTTTTQESTRDTIATCRLIPSVSFQFYGWDARPL